MPRPAPGVTPLSVRILRWARGGLFTTEDARAMFGLEAGKAVIHLQEHGHVVRVGPGQWKPTCCPSLPVTALTGPPDE